MASEPAPGRAAEAGREPATVILERISDAFFAVDREWRFTYVNRRAEQVLRRSRKNLLGRNLWDEFPEARGSIFEREYHRALAEQEPAHFEQYYAPLDVWVEVYAYPSPDGLSVFFRDVTGRKRTEERLRFQSRLLDAVDQAVIATDLEGRITFWNDAAERMFGWTAGEVLGRDVTDVTTALTSRESAREIMARLQRGESWSGDFTLRSRDGSTFPAHVTDSPIHDEQGRFVGIIGVSTDISERVRAEQELRRSERRLATLVEALPIGVWITDEAGRIVYGNPEGRRIWGGARFIRPDEFGEYRGWRLTTGERIEPHEWAAARALRHREAVLDEEIEIEAFDGTRRIIRNSALPLTGADGRFFGVVSLNQDITERKQAEREREELLRREQAARAEAERQRRELERVVDSRARLIRGFTHDVKNPLGAADGSLQLFEIGALGELEPRQEIAIARARRSLRSALDLIRSLLELDSLEAGRIALRTARIDPRRLAAEMVDEYRPYAEMQGVSVDWHAEGDVAWIETDPDRVRQVLSNLLSNAVKYTPAGGRITLRVVQRSEAEAPAPGRWIAIEVSDTGPGIPAELREQIFEEFTRLEPGTRGGAGLGLAISRRIARALGAELTVESEEGRGSTFTLWLPAP